MFKLAVRSILAQKVRYLLPTLAVVLGVAFVAGSLLYGGSVQAALDRAQQRAQPDLAVQVSPKRIDTPLSADLVQRLRNVGGAAAVRPVAEGRAFLVAKDGSLVGAPGSAGGVNYVAGPDGKDPRYPLVSGRGPAGAGEIAIDEWSAEQTGYQVGDQLRVIVGGVARKVQLVGIFTASDARLARGGTLTAFDTATARAQFSPTPDSYTSIDLSAAVGTSEDALARNVAAVLPNDAEAATRTELNTASGRLDGKLTEILLIFAVIALFVSIFLVANTFTMLAAARAREHALLRAVGAARRYVLRLVLAEAVLVGVVATVLGYLLGIGAAAALSQLFSVTDGPQVPLEVLSAGAILAALGVGVGVTTLAAYIPARRAAAVPPIAALRDGLPPSGKSLRRRNIAGLVVTALGAGMTVAGTASEDLIYLGAPVLLLGLIILTPWFGMLLTALLRRPLTRLTGIRGTLAVENTRRNPRRTAATAATLMIGLSICAAVTVPIASLAAEGERAADTGDSADVRVTAIDFAKIGPDVPARIATLPDAQAVTPVIPAGIKLNQSDYLSAAAVDPAQIAGFVPITVKQGSLDGLGRGIAVTTKEAEAHQWTVGSLVSGEFVNPLAKGATAALPIVAIYDAPATFEYGALVSTATAPSGLLPSTVLVKASPGKASALRAEIQQTLDNPTLVVRTRAEAAESSAAEFALFLNILYALLSVSVLIGALGVINTMTMSTFERIKEIGLLRAVGLARAQVGSILRLESVIIALLGALLGLGAGCVIGAVAVRSQDSIPLVMPWDRLGVFVAVTAVIGVLASLWPARKAARIPILTAIQTDTE
jgi:putative ABC transport system permease protein